VTERDAVLAAARRMADAIRRRDRNAIAALLADKFVQRTIGGGRADAAEFLSAIEKIPGEIVSIELAHLDVELGDGVALVMGVQHARVRVDGKVVDDRRPFVDWMVKQHGEWRFRAAIDVPA
jgi:ketosteroid isomerase-like protein